MCGYTAVPEDGRTWLLFHHPVFKNFLFEKLKDTVTLFIYVELYFRRIFTH